MKVPDYWYEVILMGKEVFMASSADFDKLVEELGGSKENGIFLNKEAFSVEPMGDKGWTVSKISAVLPTEQKSEFTIVARDTKAEKKVEEFSAKVSALENSLTEMKSIFAAISQNASEMPMPSSGSCPPGYKASADGKTCVKYPLPAKETEMKCAPPETLPKKEEMSAEAPAAPAPVPAPAPAPEAKPENFSLTPEEQAAKDKEKLHGASAYAMIKKFRDTRN